MTIARLAVSDNFEANKPTYVRLNTREDSLWNEQNTNTCTGQSMASVELSENNTRGIMRES